RRQPTALWHPLPSLCVYAVVRTFGIRPLVRFGFDCVAQPTIKQAPAAATARLRRFGIGGLHNRRRRQGQAIIYENSLGETSRSQKKHRRNVIFQRQHPTIAATILTRSTLREFTRTMRTTCRLDRDRHCARRALLRNWRGSWRWTFQSVHRFEYEENAQVDDDEIDYKSDEISVVPSHCACLGRVDRGI